jgi:putative NADPH-quinone reductase
MRLLVVHSHPCADSFNRALFDTVCQAASGAGHEVRPLDLHAEGFDPVMGAEERARYHERGVNEEPVRAHLDHILWAEGMIFVYPTWWYGLPAMLKGWLDRVWIPHVTFLMPEKGKGIRSGMRHVRLLGVVTTCGAPWWWSKLIGEPGRKTILRGIRALCARRCKTFYLAHYLMDSSTPESRAAYLKKIATRIAAIR